MVVVFPELQSGQFILMQTSLQSASRLSLSAVNIAVVASQVFLLLRLSDAPRSILVWVSLCSSYHTLSSLSLVSWSPCSMVGCCLAWPSLAAVWTGLYRLLS